MTISYLIVSFCGGDQAHVKRRGSLEVHAIGNGTGTVTVSGSLCGSSGEWTGSYKLTSPTGLRVEAPAASGTALTAAAGSTAIHTGAEVTIIADTIFGDIHCIFMTNGTHIGTLTSASGPTGHATLHIDSAAILRTGGSGAGLCDSSGEWTESYEVTSPTELVVDEWIRVLPRHTAGIKNGENMNMSTKLLASTVVCITAIVGIGAGSASATEVTSPAGTTPTIEAESEGATTLDGALDVTCQNSTVKGKVEQHGDGITVKGDVSSLTFSNCGDDAVVVKKAGALELHTLPNSSAGPDGTLTSSGADITIIADTIFGDIHCIFTTNGTHIGTLEGGTSSKATLDLESTIIPRTGGTGGALCGSSGEWTGSYEVVSPSWLVVDFG